MISPAGTVQQIRALLIDEVVRKTPDTQSISEAYATFCREANNRLSRCVDCLKKNMLSEALHVAEADPPLLDICAELDFVGIERWRELCRENGLAIPAAIDSNALNLLNDAYGSGLALEPMLKEYRRAVREQNTKRSVRLLRRIAEKDANNKQWLSDLRAFELKRAGEIADEAIAAERAEDSDRLGALLVELGDAWSVPPPPGIMVDVEGRLRKLNAARATVRERDTVSKLSKAYAALDMDVAGEAIAEYETLTKDRDFTPVEALRTQYEEAAEWWRQERDKRQRIEQFETAVAGLQDAVERTDVVKISETLNILARFDQRLPEMLERRAQGLLDAHALRVTRIKKRRVIIATCLVVMVMAGMGAYVVHGKALRDVALAVRQLDAAIQQDDLTAFDEVARSVQPKRRVREAAQVRDRLEQRAALVKRIETRRQTFQTAWERLDAIQKDGFQDAEAVIDGLIEQAKTSAQSSEEHGRLAVFVTAWGGHRTAIQNSIDTSFGEVLNETEAALAALGDISGMSAETVAVKLEPAKDALKRAETIRGASPALAKRCDEIRERMSHIEADVASRRTQLNAITNSMSLRGYLSELATYVKAFPNDPVAKRLATVPSLAPAYLDVVSPPSASVSNAFWGRTTVIMKAHEANRLSMWPSVKQSILSLGDDKTMVELWSAECEVRGAWLAVFFEGVPKKEYEGGMPVYSGSAYVPVPRDREPSFGTQTFKGIQLRNAKRMVHCEYVAGLIDAVRLARPIEGDSVLIQQMTALARNGEIPGLLRLRLLDFLVGEFAKVVGDDAIPEWKSFRGELKSIDPDVSWLCMANDPAGAANKKAMDIIDREFISADLPAGYAAAMAMRKAAVARNVKFVGYGDFSGRGTMVWLGGGQPDEVWVIRTEQGVQPKILLAQEVLAGTTHTYKTVAAGEPLFAPGGGPTTRELLGQIKAKTGCRATGRIDLGCAWPDNLRE